MAWAVGAGGVGEEVQTRPGEPGGRGDELRPAAMRPHDGGMRPYRSVHDVSWIRESAFMTAVPSFVMTATRDTCHGSRLVGASPHVRDGRAREEGGRSEARRRGS